MSLNKLNWTAIIVAFVVTIVIALLGEIYLPKNTGIIGPILGGLIAGYMVGGSYTDGLVQGGIPVGIAGLITFSVVTLLSQSEITTVAAKIGYTGSTGALIVEAVIGGAFGGFALFFTIGLISGIIGVAIKNRSNS